MIRNLPRFDFRDVSQRSMPEVRFIGELRILVDIAGENAFVNDTTCIQSGFRPKAEAPNAAKKIDKTNFQTTPLYIFNWALLSC